MQSHSLIRSYKVPHTVDFKSAYISLVIGPRGMACETNLYQIIGWESSDVVRFDLGVGSWMSHLLGSVGMLNHDVTFKLCSAKVYLPAIFETFVSHDKDISIAVTYYFIALIHPIQWTIC